MSTQSPAKPEWNSTACILCECNCGIEVQLGGEGGRHFTHQCILHFRQPNTAVERRDGNTRRFPRRSGIGHIPT